MTAGAPGADLRRPRAATSPVPAPNGRSTTAEELFADYPAGAIPVAGKTGTAQGRNSYPWNDSSAFAAFSIDPEQPYTVVSYLEKSGFGSTGAAPVVKCMFLALSGITPLDPVADLRAARHDDRRSPPSRCRASTTLHAQQQRRHHPAGRLSPWASRCSSASPTPASATSAPARPTPAATSTGCCCSPRPRSTVAGCFVVFSATRDAARPTRTRSSPARSIFAIAATVVMVVVMAIDYEWLKQRARTLYG